MKAIVILYLEREDQVWSKEIDLPFVPLADFNLLLCTNCCDAMRVCAPDDVEYNAVAGRWELRPNCDWPAVISTEEIVKHYENNGWARDA